MSQLRKALGADAIETRSSGYLLRADPDEVDSRHFDASSSRGASTRSGRWRAAAKSFSSASALWRGTPLTELGDWPAASAEAARLEEEHRCLVEELAATELACGRDHQLVASLEAMAEAELLRERRWVMLMQALYRCGRQVEALRAFQRARTVLAELGLELGPDLVSAERNVSHHTDVSLSIASKPASGLRATSPAQRPSWSAGPRSCKNVRRSRCGAW